MSADLLAGHLVQPQSLNRYAYVLVIQSIWLIRWGSRLAAVTIAR